MTYAFAGCEGNHRNAIVWLTKAAVALDEWNRDHVYSYRPAGKVGVKLTAADLRRAGACYAECKRFRDTWPRGLVITLPLVPVLLASGHMAPHATAYACLVAHTPYNLMKVADYLRSAKGMLDGSIPSESAALIAVNAAPNGDISASNVIRRAAEEAIRTRDGARHLTAAAALRQDIAAACRAYEAERDRQARRAAAALQDEWRGKVASAREWFNSVHSEWWHAWARDLLERKAR